MCNGYFDRKDQRNKGVEMSNSFVLQPEKKIPIIYDVDVVVAAFSKGESFIKGEY